MTGISAADVSAARAPSASAIASAVKMRFMVGSPRGEILYDPTGWRLPCGAKSLLVHATIARNVAPRRLARGASPLDLREGAAELEEFTCLSQPLSGEVPFNSAKSIIHLDSFYNTIKCVHNKKLTRYEIVPKETDAIR
jgi:hypothetical protein